MIEVAVQPEEYHRLLGYPRGFELQGRALELAQWTREWYAHHGRPWVYSREALCLEVAADSVRIDGVPFTARPLQKTLLDAGAHSAMLVAVGAGPELEEEAHRLWLEEKPDEYFFLEMYGSAVVEHLTTATGAQLCGSAEERGMAVLPHYSPGYPEWEISEQKRLLALLNGELPQPVAVLESGMLQPKKSLLAVFGLTRHTARLQRLTDLVPCQNCSFHPCQYRRAPYGRAAMQAAPDPLKRGAAYGVNTKALRRWASERLSLQRREDGCIEARFRYDGTTCTNMGLPLAFRYDVTLGPRDAGYPIREQHCAPLPDDTGHRAMCQYLKEGESLIASVEREKPLTGQPLNDVLAWQRPVCSAGCYCEPASRLHKWGLVLETIHYALAQQEGKE